MSPTAQSLISTVQAVGWLTVVWFIYRGIVRVVRLLRPCKPADRSWYEKPIFDSDEGTKREVEERLAEGTRHD